MKHTINFKTYQPTTKSIDVVLLKEPITHWKLRKRSSPYNTQWIQCVLDGTTYKLVVLSQPNFPSQRTIKFYRFDLSDINQYMDERFDFPKLDIETGFGKVLYCGAGEMNEHDVEITKVDIKEFTDMVMNFIDYDLFNA